MACPSPIASPNESDDEGEDGMQDEVTEEEVKGEAKWDVMDYVEGLMEFATLAGGKGDDTT
jgi:hypothetical protein